MAIKILVDVKGFEGGYASYEIETISGSIVDEGILRNDEVTEIVLYPSASSRMTYILNISTMSIWGNFNDVKSKIEVVNIERPEYTFLVDNSLYRSKDQWRIWSKSSIDLTITSAGRFDDEEIDITFWNTDGTIDYKSYAPPEPPKPETQIIYDVVNANIIDEVESTVFDGEKIILKAEDGYMFEDVPTVLYNDKAVEFDTYIDDVEKSYYWIYLNKDNFSDDDISQLVVIGKAVERYIEINYKLQYCRVDGIPVTKVNPSNPNFKVVLVCDDGYIFKSEPFIEYVESDQYSKKINGNVSEDKTTAILELNEFIFGNLTNIEVLGVASVKPIETTIASNLATIYKVDDDVLREISLKRFGQPNELLIEYYGDFQRKNAIDLASFIISLKHFFINIPTVQEEGIKIGFMQTEINAPVVAQDSITLDLGDIEIVGKQDNINDYSNTVVSVYLAFIGIVTLDSVLVVNKTINTRYEVNLYNGDCQVFVTNCDDVIVYMGTCNISADIPYIYDYDRKVNNQLNFYNSMNFMKDLESYVLVRSKIPVNSSLNLTEDNKETVIGNEKGLNYFTDFKIEFIADEQEKNELQILIENGIII